ncbi:MAG: energy transducer TonB [Massilia sp.]
MTTLTFDSISAPPRRQAKRSIARVPVHPLALAVPAAVPTRRAPPFATIVLVGVIAALHGAAFVTLSAKQAVTPAPAAAPITIALAPPKAIEPPPPPPPPPPERPLPRPRAAPAAPPPSAPVVAEDTPLVAPGADTVQVAHAAPPPAPVVAPAAAPVEPLTEPRGYAGYLSNPAPDYPPAAQKRGLEGRVVLKVHVLASGQPDSVAVAKSSGHQVLDEAALKAVTQWAFAPARRGQNPVDGWVQVPLTFKI